MIDPLLQLPYWEGTEMTTRRTRDGYDMQWAEYTPKPFIMKNLHGRQPASENNLLKYNEGYGSEYNTGEISFFTISSYFSAKTLPNIFQS